MQEHSTRKILIYIRESNLKTLAQGRLVNRSLGSGRNIMVGNWFRNLPHAEELLEKKFTLVGTVRKNKRELVDVTGC